MTLPDSISLEWQEKMKLPLTATSHIIPSPATAGTDSWSGLKGREDSIRPVLQVKMKPACCLSADAPGVTHSCCPEAPLGPMKDVSLLF
ncbi:hypothetical protein PBY51_010539 [Eleginops maclovinus]|uniref:Uncharacterized protein n=1 Tax=Eleginops maclovinus TaxID=56733 RepID=A0AAN7XBT8_ELEMC|nr:hypothetical protein PBY51_010539 [Eleginops maclovinus]